MGTDPMNPVWLAVGAAYPPCHGRTKPPRHQVKVDDGDCYGQIHRPFIVIPHPIVVIPGLDPGIPVDSVGWGDPRIKSGDDEDANPVSIRIAATSEKLSAGPPTPSSSSPTPSSSSPDLIRGSPWTPPVGAIPGSSPGTTRIRNPVSIWRPILMPRGPTLARPAMTQFDSATQPHPKVQQAESHR
jgi:hypothetical protein